jgi:hypothetical protein
MDNRIHQILLSHDSSTDWECPSDFNWESEWEDVRALHPEAEAILGVALRVDDGVQDASFFAELYLLEEGAIRPSGVIAHLFKIAIRFSSFGRMVTIHSNSARSSLTDYPIHQLIELLQKRGYTYIAPEDLQFPYDGGLPVNDSKFTWWYRFFDYL